MIAAVPQTDTLSEDFEALFQTHSQLVFRTAFAITLNRQDAEDVLQSVFVKLLQRGLTPELRQQPARYLHRAAVNTSLNVLRSRKRRRLADGLDVHALPASQGADARDRDERQERLTEAMARLTPRALEILLLRYEHDHTDVQIAQHLGTSRGVIAVTLHRIRARLRTLLRSTGSEGDGT
jgi:RNA polymerase sigma-70 factor (ECF subfamily)